MRKDKTQATKLRRQGKSYQEIKEVLGIPKSTLSDWLSDSAWSKEIKRDLNKKNLRISSVRMSDLARVRGKHLNKLYAEAKGDAVKEYKILKAHPLFVAGVMIYWGEGDKVSKHGFRITNSDPKIVKVFINFLKKICKANEARIRAGLLIYPDLNASFCEKYWSSSIGLPLTNFTKSILIHGRHKTRRVSHGICTLNFSSRFLKEKMLIWMSLMAKDLSEL